MAIFWKKGYGVIFYVSDVTNKILSCDSNYTVDVVMWPKFGNSSISMREVIMISILKGFDQKTHFFWGVVLVEPLLFNNFGLALGMNLKFYISVVKGSKLKVRKFYGLIPTFVEVTGEKVVRGPFWPPSILNRDKVYLIYGGNRPESCYLASKERDNENVNEWYMILTKVVEMDD